MGINNNTMLDIDDSRHYYLQMILKILRKLSAKLDQLTWYFEMKRCYLEKKRRDNRKK